MNSDDLLPSEVDVVVLGTGLPESIIAGACARSGLSVLHLDRNEYYGGVWSSFNLQSINSLFENLSSTTALNQDVDNEIAIKNIELNEGEEALAIGQYQPIQNVHLQWHITEADATESEQNGSIESDKSIRSDLEKNWRRFSIDLLPKVLLSRGSMVQILIDSEVSRYCEFKCVDRLLCLSDDISTTSTDVSPSSLLIVPCSRSEIFQSEAITMIEKRRIMKFLTSCVQWYQNPDEIEGWSNFAEKSFDEFVESRGITGNLKNFIIDTIGILQPNANAKQGLEAVNEFLQSVGRFGESPFLWTFYGSAELPQCFCRLCAVYGGTYCLKQQIDAFIIKNNRIEAIQTRGQRISCKHVIISASYLPDCYLTKEKRNKSVQRAILISNSSVLSDSQKEHISLLNLMRLDSDVSARLLEVGFGGCAAPRGYFLSHLTAHCDGSAFEKLQPIASKLYKSPSTHTDLHVDSRPPLLWSLYYDLNEPVFNADDLPSNLRVVDGVDSSLTYNKLIDNTRKMFEEIWPDRDFLPRSLPKEDDVDDGEDGGKAEGNLVETEQGIGVEEQRQRGDVQNEFVDEENAIQQQQQ